MLTNRKTISTNSTTLKQKGIFVEFLDGPKFDQWLERITRFLFSGIVLFGIPYLIYLILHIIL